MVDIGIRKLTMWTVTALAAAVATTLTAAPASADFHAPDIGSGQTLYVGQQYYISTGGAPDDVFFWMSFYDNNQCIAGSRGSAPSHSGYGWVVYWVPTTAGTHTITVSGDTQSKSTTVIVLPAPAGSTPAPQPKQPGCGPLAGRRCRALARRAA